MGRGVSGRARDAAAMRQRGTFSRGKRLMEYLVRCEVLFVFGRTTTSLPRLQALRASPGTRAAGGALFVLWSVVALSIMRAYKTELDPNETQRAFLCNSAGAARWAWNQGLSVNQRYYNETGKGLTYFRLCKLLTTWKQHPVNAWTYEVCHCCFQSALQDLTRAFQNFFEGRARYPKFKLRHGRKAFRVCGRIRAEERRLRLPNIGWIPLKERGYLPVAVKPLSCAVSERAGRWFVSFQVNEEVNAVAPGEEVIGVDLGISALAVASDGRQWARARASESIQRKLTKASRKLARQTKGSGRREVTKRRIGKLHLQAANLRANTIHELTSALVGVHGPAEDRPKAIVVEDLAVGNMLKNHCLARAISDAGWAELRRQLAYKCEWYGVTLIVADRFYPSSQLCSECGARQPMPLSEREYACGECGVVIDRDLNAARNLRDYGHDFLAGKAPERQNARGGNGKTSPMLARRDPVKRESAQVVAPGVTLGQSITPRGLLVNKIEAGE